MVDVYLYVYDLSCGAAQTLGPLILGRPVGGIWHTSVVVFNKEFFYGSHGISYCPPGGTQLKEPGEKLLMGETNVREDALFRYLERLAVTQFKYSCSTSLTFIRGGDYRLFDHNCNTFSNHLVGYLTSRQIPSYILDLPEEIASTPLGAALKPALNLLSGGLDNIPQFGLHPAFSNGNPPSFLIANFLGTNNHSFDGLRASFRPILFDEPLPAELAPSRLRFLWPDTESSADKIRRAVSIAEAILNGDPEPSLEPTHYRLLGM
ncbi:unnamed protein product [Dicrocoelium dendriticum]|nr:unnamed protein product [Dicrocoelium dendriticum]